MNEFVRVRRPIFGEGSVRYPEPDDVVLDKPAIDGNGDALPWKPLTSAAKKATEKKTTNGDEPAGTPKEG